MSLSGSPCSDAGLRESIDTLLRRAGVSAWGVAEAREVDASEWERFSRWIAAGRHGSMAYLERYADVRRDPRLLLEGAKSIIVTAWAYPEAPNSAIGWAGYALGDDYHDVIRARLSEVTSQLTESYSCQCRICTDTAPILERYWAEQAGIGFRGRNSQLIIPGKGSRFFLSEIITTLPIAPDERCRDSCGDCLACEQSCPGKAIDGSGDIDARRCISYLTIESRDELPEGTDSAGSVYGCDICQAVCPHNRATSAGIIPEFQPRPAILALTPDDILTMDQQQFSQIFRKSAIKRTKLSGLLRNVKYLIKERKTQRCCNIVSKL